MSDTHEQLDVFAAIAAAELDPPAPRYRRNDRITSRDAGRAQTPDRLATGCWLALDCLVRHGPQTDHELSHATGWAVSSIGKRRGDLMNLGYVRPTDDRRDSPSGSPCTVWAATPEGEQAWRRHENNHPATVEDRQERRLQRNLTSVSRTEDLGAKANRLLVTGCVIVTEATDSTATVIVRGDTGTHVVAFNGPDRSCTCQAWQHGHWCSHTLAASRVITPALPSGAPE